MFNWESISGLEKLTKIPSLRILFLLIRLLQKKKNITLSYVQIKKNVIKSIHEYTFNRVNDGRNAMDFLVGYDSTFDVGRAYSSYASVGRRGTIEEKKKVLQKSINTHTSTQARTHARTHQWKYIRLIIARVPNVLCRFLGIVFVCITSVSFYSTGERDWEIMIRVEGRRKVYNAREKLLLCFVFVFVFVVVLLTSCTKMKGNVVIRSFA